MQTLTEKLHDFEIEVLSETTDYLVVYKPAGMLCHAHSFCPGAPTLVRHLRATLGEEFFLGHRLDRGTSGIVLIAKNKATASVLGRHFREGTVQKTYLALVRGHTLNEGKIEKPLAEEDGQTAKPAISNYKTLRQIELPFQVGRYPSARYSLVRVQTETGRKHQVRKHFKSIDHPLVGDTTYGDSRHNRFFRSQYNLSEMMLLAAAIELPELDLSITCKIPFTWKNLFAQWCWTSPQALDTTIPDPQGRGTLSASR